MDLSAEWSAGWPEVGMTIVPAPTGLCSLLIYTKNGLRLVHFAKV